MTHDEEVKAYNEIDRCNPESIPYFTAKILTNIARQLTRIADTMEEKNS